MARDLPTVEQELQSCYLSAKDALLKAQRDLVLTDIANNNESSLLQEDEIRKSFETLSTLKERYGPLLKSMGGVDAVLKNLENYIIYEKLRDPRFAIDPTYRETKREDFIPEKEQTSDHLNERGRYKAALRTLTLKLNIVDRSDLPDEERKAEEVQFGSIFEEKSKIPIGPVFQGELKLPARELLAYFWLAACDRQMPLSAQALRENGSREKCIESEKNNLVLTLASYQRAHNDGMYAHTNRLLDNPACPPGAWGRLFKEAPLLNQITCQGKLVKQAEQERQLFVDESSLNFHVFNQILKQLYCLSPDQKLAFLNNYNSCYLFKSQKSENVLGFNLQDLVALLDKNLRDNFDQYWEEVLSKTPDLMEIVKRQAREDEKSPDYIAALFYIKTFYRAIWEREIARIGQGLLHQQALYEPFERDVLDKLFQAPYQNSQTVLLEDSEEEKNNLAAIAKKMTLLEKEFAQFQASNSKEKAAKIQAEITRLSQAYQALLREKNRCLHNIEHRGHKLVLLNLLKKVPLLTLGQNKDFAPQIVSDFFQEEEIHSSFSRLSLSPLQPSEPSAAQKLLFNNRYQQLEKAWDTNQFGEKTPQKLFIETLRVFEGKPAFLQLNANQIAFLEKEKGLLEPVKSPHSQSTAIPLTSPLVLRQEEEVIAIERHYVTLLEAKPLSENTATLNKATTYYLERVQHWSHDEIEFEKIIQKASDEVELEYPNFELDPDLYILGEKTIQLTLAEHLLKQKPPKDSPKAISLLNAAAEQNSMIARNKLYSQEILVLNKQLTLEALRQKQTFLSTQENEDKEELATQYVTALKNAAHYGSEIAKITLIKLWLVPEEVLGSAILADQQVLATINCDASDYYPLSVNILDAMTNLVLYLEKSPDPFVVAEAVKLKPKLVQRILTSEHDSEEIILVNAARLEHALSKIQIMAMLAADLANKEKLEMFAKFSSHPNPNIHFLFEEATRLLTEVPPAEKPRAQTFVEAVRNQHIQVIQLRINHLLLEQEKFAQENKAEEALAKAHEISHYMASLKRQGIALKFSFTLKELSSFKQALERLPIRPSWLVEILAPMENTEHNIRLTLGAIQHTVQQQRNADLLEKLKIYFRTHRNTGPIKIALAAYQTAESAYYKMLNEENVPKSQLEAMLAELQTKKERLNAEINYLILDFRRGLLDPLYDQDEQYIDYLFNDKEPHLPARAELERFAFFQTLIEINNNAKRCTYIIESHSNQTNILAQTHRELSDTIRQFRTEIWAAKNQLAISVDRTKNNTAAKQFQSLLDAEHSLNHLQLLLNDTSHKGMPFYLNVAQETRAISAALEKNLHKTGGVLGVLPITNANIDTLLTHLHIQRPKAQLSKEESKSLSKKSATTLHSLIESRKTPLEQEQHIQMMFSKQKGAEIELFYTPAQLDLARAYINTHLNVKDLCIDKTGLEGASLQAYLANLQDFLNSGVSAEILQWKKEPILIGFQSLDGKKSMTVEVTQYTFDQYIEKAGKRKPDASQAKAYS